MKIKIVTTEKKLTKSIVSQMLYASRKTVIDGKFLGLLVNVRKSMSKAILIEHEDEYTIFPADYEKRTRSLHRPVGRYGQSMDFDSPADCDHFWARYTVKLAGISQIYI